MKPFLNSPRTVFAAEILILAVIMIGSLYLISIRINHRCFPGGDEGSWMSVAAQLCRGEGFTTRWYEHPIQKYPLLPRPEDFRYPGLSLILASAFSIAGISYAVALWSVAILFILFLILFYLIIRKLHGPPAAILCILVTAFSLLQLEWNSVVYSEGLFGVALCLLVAASLFLNPSKKTTWLCIGLACSLLYYVRPNGILFLAGFPVYLMMHWKTDRTAVRCVLIGLAAFLIASAPWMIRNWAFFGNPLHITGGAGVLRAGTSDPFTWSFGQFINHYSPFVFVKATAIGAASFFQALHFFEKNLFILPCIGLIVGLVRRRPFYNPFIASGFIVSILACFYVSYTSSWAGVRYASSLMPFIYAFGIVELFALITSLARRIKLSASFIPWMIVMILLLAPVYYPHRYYLRVLHKPAACDQSFKSHKAVLEQLVPHDRYYLADAFGQLAFLSDRKCAGIQFLVDSTMIPEYLNRYSPALLVIKESEEQNKRIQSIMREIGRQGLTLSEAVKNDDGIYYRIERPKDINAN
jgi:hypothetical protein